MTPPITPERRAELRALAEDTQAKIRALSSSSKSVIFRLVAGVLDLLDEMEAATGEVSRIGDEAALIWGELDAAKAENARLRDALIAAWEAGGIEHEDEDCPEDDTCTCANIALINAALAVKP